MSDEPTPVRSVYVHAPFCARRCTYCDFAVSVRRTGDVEGWLEALEAEWRLVADEGLFAVADVLDTLYVGGGTPSLLGPTAMAGLAEIVGRHRLGSQQLEWTAEANPESLTPEVARGWAEAGVNRISLGAQTFHDPALRWMGRLHGPDGPERALEAARDAGIGNVSIDLIFGLPATLGRSWRDDLERALALDVPHVSLYGLTVEEGTPLGRAVREGREPRVDEERYREEFLLASEMLTDAGYLHYEVSNFARPGAEARHNAAYWGGTPYLGLGNGAHSYAPPVRRWNTRAWEQYRERVTQGRSPEESRERVEGDAARLEELWLGLRSRRGIPAPAPGSKAGSRVDRWLETGLAVRDQERIRLTPEGWLLLDELTVELSGG
ncbi:MAG: radical SAM family heme chaperone HemW [Longimicrobiales bacterium]|nr:radical SAM family heme chaperone HemW [Longimicrobiales bacterium]